MVLVKTFETFIGPGEAGYLRLSLKILGHKTHPEKSQCEAVDLFISQWVITSVFQLQLPDFAPPPGLPPPWSASTPPPPSRHPPLLPTHSSPQTNSPCVCRNGSGLHRVSPLTLSSCSLLSGSPSAPWKNSASSRVLPPPTVAPLPSLQSVFRAGLNKEKLKWEGGKSVCVSAYADRPAPQLPVLIIGQEEVALSGQTSPPLPPSLSLLLCFLLLF